MGARLKDRAGTVVVLVLILVSLAVLVPIIAGHRNDPPPASTGGVSSPGIVSDDPTVPPELQHELKEIDRREADPRYCNAHPEGGLDGAVRQRRLTLAEMPPNVARDRRR